MVHTFLKDSCQASFEERSTVCRKNYISASERSNSDWRATLFKRFANHWDTLADGSTSGGNAGNFTAPTDCENCHAHQSGSHAVSPRRFAARSSPSAIASSDGAGDRLAIVWRARPRFVTSWKSWAIAHSCLVARSSVSCSKAVGPVRLFA